ncbi:MAG: mechanosensitive ion channel [Deltaproteobacteria bacterium]|nr:mechanosensitive ion channel [Deltaproteobacteria bacterium]
MATGRHIQNRYEEGQAVRVGIVEGRILDIGMATTRIEGMAGGIVAIPNDQFLDGQVTILQGSLLVPPPTDCSAIAHLPRHTAREDTERRAGPEKPPK